MAKIFQHFFAQKPITHSNTLEKQQITPFYILLFGYSFQMLLVLPKYRPEKQVAFQNITIACKMNPVVIGQSVLLPSVNRFASAHNGIKVPQ